MSALTIAILCILVCVVILAVKLEQMLPEKNEEAERIGKYIDLRAGKGWK